MPLHVPVVVESVAPSMVEPETTGSPVLTGAVTPVTTAVGADCDAHGSLAVRRRLEHAQRRIDVGGFTT